ncbi:MAG: endonuclease [Chloroflexi bacterium]|nr:endonuclease [Chloroflexota bacterium]
MLWALAFGVLFGLVVGVRLLKGRAFRQSDRRRAEAQEQEAHASNAEAQQMSESVLRGRISEQLAPLRTDFPFEPADARFLGSPLDFIVFDGYTDVSAGLTERLREIVFIDVKTGAARLTAIERRLKVCVEEGRVHCRVFDAT